jgi:hypothetical protein
MSLGKRKTQTSYTSKVKWNALTGEMILVDRLRNAADQWEDDPRDVTEHFEAVFDMARMLVGWIDYSPFDVRMVPVGEDYGDAPTGAHKEGVRLALQMTGEHAESGPRMLTSTAIGFWEAASDLHDSYAAGLAEHPDQLPVVRIERVRELPGKQASYAPVFKITRWVPRPPSLPLEGLPDEFGKKAGATAGTPTKVRPKVRDEMDDQIPF